MKNTLKVISLAALLTGSLLPFTAGCSATSTRESTGEYVDDSAITTKVKAELVRDKTVKARQVDVATFKGVVQLSGFVDSQEEKAIAAQLAANVRGVQSVTNNIVVKTQIR
jgi:hyperosmotically inducible protein